jgi:hypothetical protein
MVWKMNQSILQRKQSGDMIKSIVEMSLFILLPILRSSLVPPPTLPMILVDRNIEVKMPGDKQNAGLLCDVY